MQHDDAVSLTNYSHRSIHSLIVLPIPLRYMAQQPRFGIQQKLVSLVLVLLLGIAGFGCDVLSASTKAQMTKYLQKSSCNGTNGAFILDRMAFDDAAAVQATLEVLPTLTGVKFAAVFSTAGQKLRPISLQ